MSSHTPAGEERDFVRRTMGVGLTSSTARSSTSAKKNDRSRTYTPHAGEERDSDRRTMGVGLTHSTSRNSTSAEKNSACGTYTPYLRSMLAKPTPFRQLIVA